MGHVVVAFYLFQTREFDLIMTGVDSKIAMVSSFKLKADAMDYCHQFV